MTHLDVDLVISPVWSTCKKLLYLGVGMHLRLAILASDKVSDKLISPATTIMEVTNL